MIVCHRTDSKWHGYVSIAIDEHAVRAHLRHGDKLGACQTQTVSTTTQTTTTAATTTTAPTTTTTSSEHGRHHKLVECKVVYVHAERSVKHQRFEKHEH